MRSKAIGLMTVLAITGAVWADTWPPAPGQAGTITVISPNSQDGAQASLWGFYTGPSGWVIQIWRFPVRVEEKSR